MQENIDNTDDRINNNEETPRTVPKKKRDYVFTEKRQLAFAKMQEARRAKIAAKKLLSNQSKDNAREERSVTKIDNKTLQHDVRISNNENEQSRCLPSAHCERQSHMSSSSDTDSSNYESDKETTPVIISGYDDNEPDSKIKITRVRRKNKINNDLERIYKEVKQEESVSDIQQHKSIVTKKQSSRRKKILDTYYEQNKDAFMQHDGVLGEIDLSKEEFDELHARFVEYEKSTLVSKLTKVEKKPRKKRTKVIGA